MAFRMGKRLDPTEYALWLSGPAGVGDPPGEFEVRHRDDIGNFKVDHD